MSEIPGWRQNGHLRAFRMKFSADLLQKRLILWYYMVPGVRWGDLMVDLRGSFLAWKRNLRPRPPPDPVNVYCLSEKGLSREVLPGKAKSIFMQTTLCIVYNLLSINNM